MNLLCRKELGLGLGEGGTCTVAGPHSGVDEESGIDGRLFNSASRDGNLGNWIGVSFRLENFGGRDGKSLGAMRSASMNFFGVLRREPDGREVRGGPGRRGNSGIVGSSSSDSS